MHQVKLPSGNQPAVNCVATATNRAASPPYSLLWAGDTAGYITVWRVDAFEVRVLPSPPYYSSAGRRCCCRETRLRGCVFLFSHLSIPSFLRTALPQGIDFVPTRSWQAHGAAINGMLTCEHHMVTISDDGYVLVSGLWKFAPVKRFDMTAACIEEGLLTTRSSVRRRLKSAGYFAPQVLYCPARLASHPPV